MKPSNGIKKKSGYNFLAQLSPLDIITIAYIFITTCYIFIGYTTLQNIFPHLLSRAGVLVFILLVNYLNSLNQGSNKLIQFIKNTYPLFFISYFYTETSFMKNIIFSSNLDIYFAALELKMWGTQPSLTFSKVMPQLWFNELMNICYFSYYLITTLVCIAIYVLKPAASFKSIFVVICSFYLYYLMYCFLPVVGPQYYFDLSNTSAPEPLLFGKIMHHIITNFEQPTGAFPSSHVGIAIILIHQAYLHVKKLFYFLLPFAIGICFATVYLKAHYVLDVLAAFITVPLFIAISNWLYHKLQNSKQLS